MLEEIFSSLPAAFVPGTLDRQMSFYFSLGDARKTVLVSADSCSVQDGKKVEQADCVCKTSPEFFGRIWQQDYRPSVGDFLSGTIKSNDPGALKTFLKCFGKQA